MPCCGQPTMGGAAVSRHHHHYHHTRTYLQCDSASYRTDLYAVNSSIDPLKTRCFSQRCSVPVPVRLVSFSGLPHLWWIGWGAEQGSSSDLHHLRYQVSGFEAASRMRTRPQPHLQFIRGNTFQSKWSCVNCGELLRHPGRKKKPPRAEPQLLTHQEFERCQAEYIIQPDKLAPPPHHPSPPPRPAIGRGISH